MKHFLHSSMSVLSTCSVLIAVSACDSARNICGDGYRPSVQGHDCVPIETDASLRHDATISPPPHSRDAGTQREAGIAPQRDAAMKDAALDAQGSFDAGDAGDASSPDANIDGHIIALDAGDAADAMNLEGGPNDASFDDATAPDATLSDPCPPDDVAAWAALHLSPSLLSTIDTCASDPACDAGLCPLDQCMREAAGVQLCDACVRDEATCVFGECFDACGPKSTDADCLACACEHGCTDAFEQCSGQSLHVCNACEPAILYCQGMHPWPALIVPILHPLL